MSTLPAIHLQAGRSRRLRAGHPWVFSNELVMDQAAKALPPGGLVRIIDAGSECLGVGSFNPHSLIAIRALSRDPEAVIDRAFLAGRLKQALALREALYDAPCYRLVHAEADGLGGLIIDRFGDAVTIEANTAGMELLLPEILGALDDVIAPATVLIKNDSPVRKLEGLDLYDKVAKGALDAPIELVENGVRFLADLTTGQKTGWFYDQRDNRAAVAQVARGRTMIDFYRLTVSRAPPFLRKSSKGKAVRCSSIRIFSWQVFSNRGKLTGSLTLEKFFLEWYRCSASLWRPICSYIMHPGTSASSPNDSHSALAISPMKKFTMVRSRRTVSLRAMKNLRRNHGG